MFNQVEVIVWKIRAIYSPISQCEKEKSKALKRIYVYSNIKQGML